MWRQNWRNGADSLTGKPTLNTGHKEVTALRPINIAQCQNVSTGFASSLWRINLWEILP
jgi:hypothetical protein